MTYDCQICGEAYSSLKGLEKHAKIHGARKPFYCNKCGTTFTQRCSLTRHMLSLHGGEESKRFECIEPGCGKTFFRQSELHKHSSVHSEYRPFVCGLCGSAFKTAQQLNRHVSDFHDFVGDEGDAEPGEEFSRVTKMDKNKIKEVILDNKKRKVPPPHIPEDNFDTRYGYADVLDEEEVDVADWGDYDNLVDHRGPVYMDVYEEYEEFEEETDIDEEERHFLPSKKPTVTLAGLTKTEPAEGVGENEENPTEDLVKIVKNPIEEKSEEKSTPTTSTPTTSKTLPPSPSKMRTRGVAKKEESEDISATAVSASTEESGNAPAVRDWSAEDGGKEATTSGAEAEQRYVIAEEVEGFEEGYEYYETDPNDPDLTGYEDDPLGLSVDDGDKLVGVVNTTDMDTVGAVSTASPQFEVYLEKRKRLPNGRLARKMFICEVCGMKVVNVKRLYEHFSKHTGEKPFTCETCGQSFTRTDTYRKHKKQMHDYNHVFTCPDEKCAQECYSKYEFIIHMGFHKDEYHFGPGRPPGIPNFAGSNASSSQRQNKPQRKKYTSSFSGKHFACHKCDKSYKHQGRLERHLLLHTLTDFKEEDGMMDSGMIPEMVGMMEGEGEGEEVEVDVDVVESVGGRRGKRKLGKDTSMSEDEYLEESVEFTTGAMEDELQEEPEPEPEPEVEPPKKKGRGRRPRKEEVTI